MKLNETLNIPLRSIDREIENIIKHDKHLSNSDLLSQSILKLVNAGGKRIRPLMVVVGSRFGPSPDKKQIWQLAAIAEFIHAASLIHDDIIDDSPLRRGQPALHIQLGIERAIYLGNYMSARVMELVSQYSANQERYAYDLSSLVTTQLCLGEYQQLTHKYDYEITIEQYLEKTKNKTAGLMASCLQIGARAAKAPEEVYTLLYQFGEKLGMSFQILDDLLDFIQTSHTLGKPAGNDLKSGQVTLPVLFALQDKACAALITSIDATSSSEEVQLAIEAISNSDALAQTKALSNQYLNEAQQIIEQLVTYPAHRDLRTLLDYFSGRDY